MEIRESWFQDGDLEDVARVTATVDPRIRAAGAYYQGGCFNFFSYFLLSGICKGGDAPMFGGSSAWDRASPIKTYFHLELAD
jgi:hypothetical protein